MGNATMIGIPYWLVTFVYTYCHLEMIRDKEIVVIYANV